MALSLLSHALGYLTPCERQSRRAGNQATNLLKLAMGEPNRCFYNATRAVWAHPDRLVYVEGFYINEYHLTPHAWVLDKLTITRHELSFRDQDPNAVYIGQAFTKFEMEDTYDVWEPDEWKNLLTLQQQFEMLTAAGYDVELTLQRGVAETDWLVEYGDIVDPSGVDLTEGGGLEDGWEYSWRRRDRG